MLKVLLALVVLGAVIYLVLRLVGRGGHGGGAGPARGPVAPDDDPSFLRDLDTQLWEQQRREREQPHDPPSS